MVEDATDIILNLKQVPKLHAAGRTLRIGGAGEVPADIEHDGDGSFDTGLIAKSVPAGFECGNARNATRYISQNSIMMRIFAGYIQLIRFYTR